MHIGKVAAPAAGNANFLTRGFGVIDQQHAPLGLGRAHHSCGASAYNNCIIHHGAGLH
jgi:hypothetical protein